MANSDVVVDVNQPDPNGKKNNNRTWVIVIVLVLLLPLCCCCSIFFAVPFTTNFMQSFTEEFQKELENSVIITSPVTENGQNTESSQQSVVIPVGEEKVNGDMTITLKTVENPHVYTNSLYNVDAGEKLVAVEVEMRNNGTLSESINPYFYQLRDDEGNLYDKSFLFAREPEFISGTLEPGGIVSGWITFVVRENSTGLVLTQEDPLTGNIIEFQLS